MKTKLTLTLERSSIMKAKKYAHAKSRSVSKMVEEYLKNLTDKNDYLSFNNLNAPITESLAGMFKDSGKHYKTMLAEARCDRHL